MTIEVSSTSGDQLAGNSLPPSLDFATFWGSLNKDSRYQSHQVILRVLGYKSGKSRNSVKLGKPGKQGETRAIEKYRQSGNAIGVKKVSEIYGSF